MNSFRITTPLVALAMVAGPALAQAAPAVAESARPAPTSTARPAVPTQADRIVAVWAQLDNRFAVELSRMAVERAQDDAIREFARTVIETHDKCIDKLSDYSGSKRLTGEAAAAGKQAMPAKASGGESAPRPAAAGQAGELDHTALLVDLCEQRLESAETMLRDKTGAAFDRCFLMMQAFFHADAIDHLQVLRDYASPQLSKLLASGLEQLREHRKRVQQLADSNGMAALGMAGADREQRK